MSETYIDSLAIDEFMQDYKIDRQQRLATQSANRAAYAYAWQAQNEATQAMKTTANPLSIVGLYRQPENLTKPYTPEVQAYQQQNLNYVNTIERLVYENRGDYSITEIMSMEEEDLMDLNLDQYGVDFDWFMRARAIAAASNQFTAGIEAEVEKRYQALVRGENWSSVLNHQPVGFGWWNDAPSTENSREAEDPGARARIEEEVWLEFTGQRDKIFEDDISDWADKQRRYHRAVLGDQQTPQMGWAGFNEDGTLRERPPIDKLTPEEVDAAVEEMVRADVRNLRQQLIAGADSKALFGQVGTFQALANGGMNVLGFGFDKAAWAVGGGLWLIDQALPGSNIDTGIGVVDYVASPYDYLRMRKEAELEEEAKLIEDRVSAPDEAQLVAAAQLGIEQAWRGMPDTDPSTYETYMTMADGDQVLAMGFFGADVTDNPTVRQQLELFVEQTNNQDEDLLVSLRESDFRASHELLDILSMWGRNGPGRLSTAFTLLLNDADMWDLAANQKYGQLWNELGEQSSNLDFQPSSVLGLDGSLAGLAMDLGLGMAFDPTTYFLGPKFLGAGKGAAVGTVDDAMRLVRSKPVRAMVDDIINWAQSPNRGAHSMYLQMSWLDDIAQAQILDVTGIMPRLFDRPGKWRNTRGAMEVRIDALRKLAPDLDDTLDVTKLSDDILTNNFDQAGTIQVSRADGTMKLVDGNKRLLAADLSNVSHMPVRLQVVDDVLGGVSPDDLGIKLKSGLGKTGDVVTTRPDFFLPGEFLLGKVDKAKLQKIVESAVLRGNRPADGVRRSMHTSLPGRVKRALKNNVPMEIRSLFTKANSITKFRLHGPNYMDEILTAGLKMWGDDIASADDWFLRLMEHNVKAQRAVADAEARLSVLAPLQNEVRSLIRASGGEWDDVLRQLKDDVASGAADSAQLQQAIANQAQLKSALGAKIDDLQTRALPIYRQLDNLPDQSGLDRIMQEMWEDYNRKHIVPRWKRQIKKNPDILDPEKGIVKWDYLRGYDPTGRTNPTKWDWLPETMQAEAKAVGLADPEKLGKLLNNILETPMSTNVPLSPLDMIVASTRSGAAWTRWTAEGTLATIRDITHAANSMWRVDKVLRPATAATVSADELLRIFHKGGYKAVNRYVNDRVLFTQARLSRIFHGENPLARDAVARATQGTSRLNNRVRNRLQELQRYTMRSREFERMFYDDIGLGWTDIMPGEADYLDAAKAWSGTLTGQSGFRAFLRGKDDFAEWFNSVDADDLRRATVLTKNGPTIMKSVDDAYEGWRVLFEDVILKRARDNGKYDDVLAAFKEVAESIDSNKANIDLPHFVYENLGPIRGIRKHPSGGPMSMTNAFFDRFFLDPVNYRRGFVADMVGKFERARLEALYKSQGMQIVSDFELAQKLGYKGLSPASRMGVKEFLTESGLKRGMVPESYIDDLVTRFADEEMSHMLYVADEGRRVGNIAAATIFPFGKPWADMMGFWGREMLRRPHWRGKLTQDNWYDLGNIMTLGNTVNPRPLALGSRLAATDFTVDRGWSGTEEGARAGILKGSESTDFSPIMFLPTGGENPFMSLIPGLGYFPLWALDMVLQNVVDPVNNPQEYQQLVEAIGDVVPGARFSSASPALSLTQKVFGGGTLGQLLEVGLDIAAYAGDSSTAYGAISLALGQPDREIDRSRMVSAVLAEDAGAEITEIMAITDNDALNLYLESLILQADQRAALSNISETASRFAIPATSKYSGELDVLWEVWLNAGQQFSFLGSPEYNDDLASPEERRRYADNVRRKFFQLPQWQRDYLISEDNTLAVNLVSGFEWTDEAREKNVEGTQFSYRTGGSDEDFARHDLYLDLGYVRPVPAQDRIRRIIGTIFNAKEQTIKHAWNEVAGQVNGLLWEVAVDEETRGMLDVVFTVGDDLWAELDIRSPQELWEEWSRYETEFEDWVSDAMAIVKERGPSTRNEDLTEYDILRRAFNIPGKQKAWSTDFAGMGSDQSGKLQRFPVFRFARVNPELQAVFDHLGVDTKSSMNGQQLINELKPLLADSLTNPVRVQTNNTYRVYSGQRSAPTGAADDAFSALQNNPNFSEGWRGSVRRFHDYAENIYSRYEDAALGVPTSEVMEVQRRYLALAETAPNNVGADWEQLWNFRYKNTYGPLGWTAPEPLSPRNETGELRGTAYRPIISDVIDGDSLVVRNELGQAKHEVRLLGVRTRDYGIDNEGALEDERKLRSILRQALDNGDKIYLVREPETYGNVDPYGRELAWLWIGETPYYFPDTLDPTRDPSGAK